MVRTFSFASQYRPMVRKDGLLWIFPSDGSRSYVGHDPRQRSGPMRSQLEMVRHRWVQWVVGVPNTVVKEFPQHVFQNPRLEAALRAMGDYDGPEVATLKSSCVD